MKAVDGRGNAHAVVNWGITEEGLQAMREGWMCARCTEYPLPESFPEACPVCGFPIRAEQARELADSDELDMGPSPARKALEEEREREAFKKRTGIWLPGDN